MTDTLLPDVSEFQAGTSAPNWAGIKSVNGGAGIIRVGYGNSHLDHMFVNNYTAMKTNKFSFIGLYHYLRADQDVMSQARSFTGWVGPPSAVYPGTVFMLDLEEGAGDQSGRANQWHSLIDSYYGLDKLPLNMRSWIYSYTSFLAAHNLGGIFASQRRSWVAAYSSTEPSVGHTLWQCTDGKFGSHIVSWPGAGRCDTSIAHRSLTELAAMGWKGGGVVTFHGEYTTDGTRSLAAEAVHLGLPINTLLRMTAVNYQTFGDVLGTHLSDVLTGVKPVDTHVPAGVKLFVA